MTIDNNKTQAWIRINASDVEAISGKEILNLKRDVYVVRGKELKLESLKHKYKTGERKRYKD